jgi:hypothetical protein
MLFYQKYDSNEREKEKNGNKFLKLFHDITIHQARESSQLSSIILR